VYARSWRAAIIPIISWCSSLVFIVLYISYRGMLTNNASLSLQTAQYRIAFFFCNIVVNAYATSAIVYRILSVSKNSLSVSRRLHRIGHIVAQSGIIYTFSSVLNLVFGAYVDLSLHHQNGAFLECLFTIINFSLTGITFNLILLRVGEEGTRPIDRYADSQQFSSK